MTTQVRRLEDAGMVSRSVDPPEDARAVLIEITPPEGVETLRQVRADRGAAIDPYLERLSSGGPRDAGRRRPCLAPAARGCLGADHHHQVVIS